MKSEEKKLIFNLLKTASSNLAGYTPDFYKKDYEFQDDAEQVSEENKSATIPAASTDSTATSATASLPASHKVTLADITTKISRCTNCALARTRNNVVPGTGVAHPEVLVIGEAPGFNEDIQGLPFVGKAGMLLDKMLSAIQLSRTENCYITNILKCRPENNRDPFPNEQEACSSFLEAQIHVLKPKMILCMGRIAGHKLLDNDTPMSQLHGKIFDYKGIPLLVTYHPSALLQNEELKRPAWEDLKIFRKHLDTLKD